MRIPIISASEYNPKRPPAGKQARNHREISAKLARKLPKKIYNIHNINMLPKKNLPVNPQSTVGKKWEITGKKACAEQIIKRYQ
jgi:hypothetical protein